MIKHYFSDSLYAKEIHVPANMMIVQHKHNYDHLGVLAKGKVRVTYKNEVLEIEGPYCFNIEKNKHHGILALTDCVWYCIHATDETDINKVDKVLIKEL